jgi:hypothetical protein
MYDEDTIWPEVGLHEGRDLDVGGRKAGGDVF